MRKTTKVQKREEKPDSKKPDCKSCFILKVPCDTIIFILFIGLLFCILILITDFAQLPDFCTWVFPSESNLGNSYTLTGEYISRILHSKSPYAVSPIYSIQSSKQSLISASANTFHFFIDGRVAISAIVAKSNATVLENAECLEEWTIAECGLWNNEERLIAMQSYENNFKYSEYDFFSKYGHYIVTKVW